VTESALTAGALYAVPAVVWATIAWRQWSYVRLRRPRSLGFRMLPLVGGAFAVHYALLVGVTLAPLGLHDDPSRAVESPIALAWEVSWPLRFARRDELHLAPVDLAELVRGALASLRPRLDAASIELALDLRAGVLARADGEKLRQVLVNLLENSLDALSGTEGPRRIFVDVVGVNGHATLALDDSGPGVPPDALPRLFEPFFSLKADGTGLGLAIAKRTVEAHGGRITAAPGPHGGLLIEVELPLAGGQA
jgi:signal transduction histidine kinase